MSFDKCDVVMGGKFIRLKEDGEKVQVQFMDEPKPSTSEFRGKIRYQALFPVATGDGLRVISFGVTPYQYIRDNWEDLKSGQVRITRNGKPNDQNTTYEVVKASEVDPAVERVAESATEAEIADLWKAAEQASASGNDVNPPV